MANNGTGGGEDFGSSGIGKLAGVLRHGVLTPTGGGVRGGPDE